MLAIDQGGTKTAALLGDDRGNIFGVGYGTGACFFAVGHDRAISCVEQALSDLANRYGLTDWRQVGIERVSAGMSGANWPDECEAMEKRLNAHFRVDNAYVINDCVPAMLGGTTAPNAVVLCAGSGFNSAVRVDGEIVWIYNNYIEAFDAGGSGIAQRALVSVFRTDTKMGPPTSLRERALEFFGYPDVLSLLLDYDRRRMKQQVKDFAYCVDEEAVRGDAVARAVQMEFGRSVSRYASAAIRKYGLENEHVDVVLSGGAFKAKTGLSNQGVRDKLARVCPNVRVVDARLEPVVGAYLMGLERARGGSLDVDTLERVERSVRSFNLIRSAKSEPDGSRIKEV
ncbi:MAG: hypothetical protein LBS72_06185 [Oscillospiraceae bacterium]|jgi:N-acetylglucosamine kinase-like BadF-type ATPase|nr:hypothetical protein [Oscillospiraceae bacterium]